MIPSASNICVFVIDLKKKKLWMMYISYLNYTWKIELVNDLLIFCENKKYYMGKIMHFKHFRVWP